MVFHCADYFYGGCVSIDNDPTPGKLRTSTDESWMKCEACGRCS